LHNLKPLKKKLIEYFKNDWGFPENIDGDSFVDELIEALSSLDGNLRDRLAFPAFTRIVKSGKVSDEKCRSLYHELITEKYLLKGLGKERDDSVLGRSSFVYAAWSFLEYDKTIDNRIFGSGELKNFFDILLKLVREEKDFRGWDETGGWASVIANTAGILETIVSESSTTHAELLTLMVTIKDKICIDYYRFINGEDHALINTVISILNRNLITEAEFSSWVDSFLVLKPSGKSLSETRLSLNMFEFFFVMRHRFGESNKNLRPYVIDAIVKLF